jgi:predicted nucleotidyltransferase
MITVDRIKESVCTVADEYGIKKAELFGSYADGCATDDSDVDLLVEFDTPSVSLFKLSGLTLQLNELLGVNVDVIHSPVTPGSLLIIKHRVTIHE